MNPELEKRLQSALRRRAELERLLADPRTLADPRRLREAAREFNRLGPAAECYEQYLGCIREAEAARELSEDGDPEMRAMAAEERRAAVGRAERRFEELRNLLLQGEGEEDRRNVFLEIRSGTGGREAALFAADLFRMYSRCAEKRGWSVEVLSGHESEGGGWKEIISCVSGDGACARLQFESGVHRVQRIPETESQGRIHTSACTVAALPEADETEIPAPEKRELRIETFRASGAGGQHVNKTDSAVRITHLPSGTTVECQQERSQLQNRARALQLLQARLQTAARERRARETALRRRSLVGSGDRSERIRTYNFPQGRVTDHRVNLSLYRLPEILDGDLEELHRALREKKAAERLRSS